MIDRFDADDECVSYFLSWCDADGVRDSSLVNFEYSDFVNICMCYTRDLLRFWADNEDSVKRWFNEACEAYGYTSTLEALEGQQIDDPDDMAVAMVNLAMTYLGGEMWREISEAD